MVRAIAVLVAPAGRTRCKGVGTCGRRGYVSCTPSRQWAATVLAPAQRRPSGLCPRADRRRRTARLRARSSSSQRRAAASASPLQVGYISPDLFTHSVSYFAEAPLAHHSPAAVRHIVYSCVPKASLGAASGCLGWQAGRGRGTAVPRCTLLLGACCGALELPVAPQQLPGRALAETGSLHTAQPAPWGQPCAPPRLFCNPPSSPLLLAPRAARLQDRQDQGRGSCGRRHLAQRGTHA